MPHDKLRGGFVTRARDELDRLAAPPARPQRGRGRTERRSRPETQKGCATF